MLLPVSEPLQSRSDPASSPLASATLPPNSHAPQIATSSSGQSPIAARHNDSPIPEAKTIASDQGPAHLPSYGIILAKRRNVRKSTTTGRKQTFVLDCCKKAGPILPSYNGLQDRHLAGYFENPRIRKHLVGMRLVSAATCYAYR